MTVPASGSVGVKVDVTKAIGKIGRLTAALSVGTILRSLGANELRWTGLNLQQAGKAPGGEPWKHMAPMTIRLRPLRNPDGYHFSSPYQTLLQQSMVVSIDEGSATFSVGTNAKWAKDHQFGVPPRLPARKLVSSQQGARARAVTMLKAMVAKFAVDLA